MNTKSYWDDEWKNTHLSRRSSYAKRCSEYIQVLKYKNLLHIGCGTWRDSLYFAKKWLKVTAIDISSFAIEKLRSICHKNIIVNVEDIRDFVITDSKFDVIYANLSLQYFDDKITIWILSNLYRALNFGGTIFIRCKSVKDFLSPKEAKPWELIYSNGCYRNFFSKEYMIEKLEQSNYKIIQVRRNSWVHHSYRSHFIEAIGQKTKEE